MSYGTEPGVDNCLEAKSWTANVECQTILNSLEACTQTDVLAESRECIENNHHQVKMTKLFQSQFEANVFCKHNDGDSGDKDLDETDAGYTKVAQLNLYHRAVQTEWYGRDMYHKTTQYPEVHYSQDVEERTDTFTVVSPKVPRGPPQYTCNYKCAEVRSASGVIYGFCPKAIGPGQSEALCTANLSTSKTETLQSNAISPVTASSSEMTPAATAAMTASPAANTRGVIPGMRVSPVVLPGMFSPAIYPVGFQYPASICPPPNYMMTYPCVPQPPAVTVNSSQSSTNRPCTTIRRM